jgi:hypothetical protein
LVTTPVQLFMPIRPSYGAPKSSPTTVRSIQQYSKPRLKLSPGLTLPLAASQGALIGLSVTSSSSISKRPPLPQPTQLAGAVQQVLASLPAPAP